MEQNTVEKVVQWGRDKGINDPIRQTLKTLSEAGELADAIAKSNVGKKDHYELVDSGELVDVIDAIGDIEVCLIILKDQLKLPQKYPLDMAWEVIKNRTGNIVNGTFIKNV